MKNVFLTRFVVVTILVNLIFLDACTGLVRTPVPTFPPLPASTSTSTPIPIPTRTPLPPSSTPELNTIISDKDFMRLLYIPAGQFTMGSESGADDERPAHRVYLDEFWVDQTEVTMGMYVKCVNAKVCKKPLNMGSIRHANYYGSSEFEDFPMIHADWNMAKTYCEWVGRRLPTEAEWEKAARGEESLTYPWGNEEPNSRLLNFDNQKDDLAAVGSYPNGASPYGVLDMAGNVSEWVADWYSDVYYAGSPSANPLGPSSGLERVLKGGTWMSNAIDVRSSNRDHRLPNDACVNCGFRCAISRNQP